MAEQDERPCNNSLVCPLCLDIFEKATLLACGHTFCKVCLQNLDKIKRKNASSLVCPLCRRESALGRGRVDGLPPNITVNSLVDDFNNNKFLSSERGKETPPVPAAGTGRARHSPSSSWGLMMPPVDESASGRSILAPPIPPRIPKSPIPARPAMKLPVDNPGDVIRTDAAVSSSTSQGLYAVPNRLLAPKRAPLTILKEVDLPAGIRDMALFAPETVILVYGSSLHGAQRFRLTGEETMSFQKLGAIRSVAMLSDRRAVVSLGKEAIQECDINGKPTDRQFRFKNYTKYYYVCRDHRDNLYAINGNPEIYSFVLGKEKPVRVIPTGKMIPSQICVTKSGAVVASSGTTSISIVAVFGSDGCVGSCINSQENEEFLFPAVDPLDHVFVASVKPRTGLLVLSRYKLKGTQLTDYTPYRALKLIPTAETWCKLVCLSPKLLALASMTKKLYFIQI